MGKSEKKIKSDRINSLRKKYDAFLEEDKKRKERNEYILEKLDKMRYCNAVVPVRQKATILAETNPALLHNVPSPSVAISTSLPYNDPRFLHLESPRKNLDASILQEISKKYILIPKVKQTSSDYRTDGNPNEDDNTDWKSKYQILEQLKRDEKEQDSSSHHEIFPAEQDHPNITDKEYTTVGQDEFLNYKREVPDHIPSEYNKLSYSLQRNPPYATDKIEKGYYDSVVNEIPEIVSGEIENHKNTTFVDKFAKTVNVSSENNECNVNNVHYNQPEIHHDTELFENNNENDKYVKKNAYESNTSPDAHNSIDTKEATPKELYLSNDTSQNIVENVHDSQTSDSQERPKVHETNPESENNEETYLDKEEVTLVNDINAGHVINVINNETFSNENTEYPIETVDVQDFTPHDDVQLQESVNINPEPQGLPGQDDLTQQFDPIVDTENTVNPTKPFDTEQSQELYNEHVDQNYDYTEEALQDNYNTEYTAPGENYEQTEYPYYEGAQTEQAYQEVAAENEEPSQRYDQNYEQQYGATYDQETYPEQGYEEVYAQQGFEQTEYSEQMQPYEPTDQAQQGLDTVQYENQDGLTHQYVEQQLDNEQGYVEKQDTIIEDSNVENSGEVMENFESSDQQVAAQ